MKPVIIGTVADIAGLHQTATTDLYGVVPWPGGKDFQAMEVGRLDRAIEERGVWAEWRRGLKCPCARPESHQPRIDCEICGGLFSTYPEEMRARVKVLLTSRTAKGEPNAAGAMARGGVRVSFRSTEPPPAENDVVLPQRADGSPFDVHVVEQVMTRASNQVSTAAIAWALSDAGSEPPPGRPRAEVLLYDLGKTGKLEMVAWREGQRLCQASEGADFTLQGQRVVWRPGRGPAAGASYVVRYQAPAAYMLTEVTPRMTGETLLPWTAQAMRIDKWDSRRDYAS